MFGAFAAPPPPLSSFGTSIYLHLAYGVQMSSRIHSLFSSGPSSQTAPLSRPVGMYILVAYIPGCFIFRAKPSNGVTYATMAALVTVSMLAGSMLGMFYDRALGPR